MHLQRMCELLTKVQCFELDNVFEIHDRTTFRYNSTGLSHVYQTICYEVSNKLQRYQKEGKNNNQRALGEANSNFPSSVSLDSPHLLLLHLTAIINVYSYPCFHAFPPSSVWSLYNMQEQRQKPSPPYHESDVNIYLRRQRGRDHDKKNELTVLLYICQIAGVLKVRKAETSPLLFQKNVCAKGAFFFGWRSLLSSVYVHRYWCHDVII